MVLQALLRVQDACTAGTVITTPHHPGWRALLPALGQPTTLRVALFTTCDEGVCKSHLRLGNRLSGAVEDESCGLGCPLHHRDGRTFFNVHHITCFSHASRVSTVPTGSQRTIFFVTGQILPPPLFFLFVLFLLLCFVLIFFPCVLCPPPPPCPVSFSR